MAVRPGLFIKDMPKNLIRFTLQCLQKILNVKWPDKISNTTVLEKVNYVKHVCFPEEIPATVERACSTNAQFLIP